MVVNWFSACSFHLIWLLDPLSKSDICLALSAKFDMNLWQKFRKPRKQRISFFVFGWLHCFIIWNFFSNGLTNPEPILDPRNSIVSQPMLTLAGFNVNSAYFKYFNTIFIWMQWSWTLLLNFIMSSTKKLAKFWVILQTFLH